jgi:protein gp37
MMKYARASVRPPWRDLKNSKAKRIAAFAHTRMFAHRLRRQSGNSGIRITVIYFHLNRNNMSTKIEWCTETWNPVVGCTKVSPGCDNCYAERMARRIAGIASAPLEYDSVIGSNGWTGVCFFNDSRTGLLKPLSWRKPRRIFIPSMGDLFFSEVNNTWRDWIMAIMALKPEHTFMILTKRPDAMKRYFEASKEDLVERWASATYEMGLSDKNDDADACYCYVHNRAEKEWPFKNIWLGVTAEDQQRANERVPVLLSIPAAKRFVSVEPMLEKIDLVNVFGDRSPVTGGQQLGYIDWVICGGESGPGARPMHPDWARFLQIQCKTATVPFFFKQWGEWLPSYDFGERLDKLIKNFPKSRIGKDHVFEDGIHMYKIGKKAAGALLDGKRYREYPKS